MCAEGWRQSWGCDCGGAVGPERPADPFVDASRLTMKHITGTEPRTCPWRAFDNPIVRDVVRAHQWFESGNLSQRLGSRIPYVLIQGLEVFDQAVNATDGERLQRRMAELKSKG